MADSQIVILFLMLLIASTFIFALVDEQIEEKRKNKKRISKEKLFCGGEQLCLVKKI